MMRRLAFILALSFFSTLGAFGQVIISEFMAKNATSIVDEDGSHEDWIEIYNTSTNTVDLFNWSLTDNPGNLTKWRFPSTNIGPGKFIMVFASNKNRRTPGANLHTNFKLDPNPGEYLALVRPDLALATVFAPIYPAQAQDVSYGFQVTATTNTLLATNAVGKYLVPTSVSQDLFWIDPSYVDASWSNATAAIGYAFPTNVMRTDLQAQMSNVNSSVYLRLPFTVPDAGLLNGLSLRMRFNDGFVAYLNGSEVARQNAPSAALGGVIANSTNDWSLNGAQGFNNWYYGYYNKSIDTGDNNFTFSTDFNYLDPLWAFNGTSWVEGLDDPPVTSIGRSTWTPNGTNNFQNHWAIRRWISPVSGVVTAQVSFAKATIGGNGATLRMLINGGEITARTIGASDTTGFTTNIVVSGLDAGDVIDFALDSLGTDGAISDASDLCNFGVTIRQAPNSDPYFGSAATGPATTAQATTGATFDLSPYIGFLSSGTNVLCVHGLNVSSNDSNFLISPELFSVTPTINTNQGVYFVGPTPRQVNGAGTTNLGPLLVDVAHTPFEPASNQVVTVTARGVVTFDAVTNLTMRYRVMYNSEVAVTMLDDGTHGDGAAGDGVYGAFIPANIASSGQMIRYYISAADATGDTNRAPTFATTASPQYFGLVVQDLSITSSLPVLHWFIQTPTGANSDAGTRCSIYFYNQFLDNVGVTLHGQSSGGFPKKSHNFNLNSGYKISVNPDYPDMSDFAIISTWADRTHSRIPMNTEAYQTAGVPAHFAFPLRVQQNGAFFSVANFNEQGNGEYLKRIGYDSDGALYKIYNALTTIASNEKKTRKYEPNYDLQALVTAVNTGDQNTRSTYVYDNVNIPAVVDFLAVKAITQDHDCCHKNFYLYRDSNGSGEWTALPWDFDLSLGHVWTSGPGYFDDTMYTNTAPNIGGNSALFGAMYADPVIKQMWNRRVRSLMDQQLQPINTTANDDLLRNRFDYYANLVRSDAMLDKIKWGGATWTAPVYGPANPTTSNPTNNFDIEQSRVKDFYLPGRRTFLYLTGTNTTYQISPEQPVDARIQIGAVEFNPASSNQAQEYIEVINTNTYPVDVSGWKLSGGVDFIFAPGTVIGPANRIYVSPDVKSFRARTTGPRGGQKLMVVGPYKGQLSARGESLTLVNTTGVTNSVVAYAGAPSSAQQYLRITEIMYHPPAPATATYGAQDFEYIELRNISTNVSLNLNGIRFTNGVDFSFAGSAITNLGPGARCLVVKSNAAFASRYGGGLPVAGTYAGSLDNAGERLQLLDAVNEEILDFSYNNSWYPITDGLGFSLVVVDENAQPDAWGSRSQWRASGSLNGSPGVIDALVPAFAPILVNEALTHTDPPATDVVELFNPTGTNVNVGGWFLTDNFTIPKKFRIPAGTMITAGGFLLLTETNFNVGGTGFAFSSTGEEVYLFSGDANTNLTGYYHGFSFGAIENGISFGRYANSQGTEFLVPQSTNTLGATNARPRIGPIVMSEIMYRPAALTTNDPPASYIELVNIAATNVPLYTLTEPTNTWHLRGDADFDFPTNVTLAPGATVVVVSFNPATNASALASFRARYGVGTSVPVYGPYAGSLPNDSGLVKLEKPDFANTNSVPYVEMETIHYLDMAPWPALADGFGAALTRVVRGDFADDATNWVAAFPSPGTNYPPGIAPAITLQPQSQNAYLGTNVSFTVAATGTGPLQYQWTANGLSFPVTANPTFTITNAQRSQSGVYSVLIMSPYGSVLSTSATLLVQAPIVITAQPQSTNLFPFQTANFIVSHTGDAPVYQWRSNGVNLAGATSTTFTRTNVQPSDGGTFTVLITNTVSSVLSAPATLTVLLRPTIVQQPLSQNVFAGSNASFGVVAVSSTPLRYQWYFTNGVVGPGVSLTNYTALPGATNNTLLVVNCQEANVGSYRVAVWDNFGTNLSEIANLDVQTKPLALEGPFATNVVRIVGSNASFTLNVRGGLPINFRWRKNGLTTLTNMYLADTTSVYSMTSITHSNAGYYDVSLTNAFGSTTPGSRAYLTVMDPLTNRVVRTGSNTSFAVLTSTFWNTNTGAGNANLFLRWQWFFNETNLLATGATNTTVYGISLSLTNIQQSNEGSYTLLVTNGSGTIASQTAQLVIARPPVITGDPTNQSIPAGGTASFAVSATGPALSYQWRLNNADLPGQTGSVITINNAQVTDSGNYRAVVSNSEGSVTSLVAVLTVLDVTPPVPTCPVVPPVEATGPSGAVVSFSVTATDNLDPNPTVMASPASGSIFPVGSTPVLVTAYDASGNTNTCSFNVLVRDTTAPVLVCPTNRVVPCTETNGAQVSFTVSAMDLVDGLVSVIATPASGAWFPLGTNVVTCRAVDAHQNTNTCTFEVVVRDDVAPVLEIVLSGSDVVISWPASCTSYALKRTDDLNAPANWQAVTAPVSYVNGRFQVTVPLSETQRFYRMEGISSP